MVLPQFRSTPPFSSMDTALMEGPQRGGTRPYPADRQDIELYEASRKPGGLAADNDCNKRDIQRSSSATEQDELRNLCHSTEGSAFQKRPGLSPAELHGPSASPPYTDGPSQIFLSNDGVKDCLAMLISEGTVTAIGEISRKRRALSKKDFALNVHGSNMAFAQCEVDQQKAILERAESQEDADQARLKLEELHQKLLVRGQQHEAMAKEVERLKSSLQYAGEDCLRIFEHVLGEADLIDLTDVSSDPGSQDSAVRQQNEEDAGMYHSNDDTDPDAEELFRRKANDDLTQCFYALEDCQFEFDDRQQHYQRELADYEQCVAEGRISMSRTVFDGHLHLEFQRFTRALIDAEDGYKNACAHAKALGVIEPSYSESSYCGRQYEESLPENQLSAIALRDWSFVENWLCSVEEISAENMTDLESTDVDELWDARPVEISDSISAVAEDDFYREKISRWREIRGELEENSVAICQEN